MTDLPERIAQALERIADAPECESTTTLSRLAPEALSKEDAAMMIRLFRRTEKKSADPLTNGEVGASRGPIIATALVAVTALAAELASDLAARTGTPHNDAMVALFRRHKLVRTARLFLVHAEHSGTLLSLLMDFRDFALN